MVLQGEAAGSWVSKRLVVAEELVQKLSEKLGVAVKPLASFTGEQLEHCRYRHPMEAYGREGIVVLADYVTTESGTGLVHSAPGHGQDDFQVCCPVSAGGLRFHDLQANALEVIVFCQRHHAIKTSAVCMLMPIKKLHANLCVIGLTYIESLAVHAAQDVSCARC